MRTVNAKQVAVRSFRGLVNQIASMQTIGAAGKTIPVNNDVELAERILVRIRYLAAGEGEFRAIGVYDPIARSFPAMSMPPKTTMKTADVWFRMSLTGDAWVGDDPRYFGQELRIPLS